MVTNKQIGATDQTELPKAIALRALERFCEMRDPILDQEVRIGRELIAKPLSEKSWNFLYDAFKKTAHSGHSYGSVARQFGEFVDYLAWEICEALTGFNGYESMTGTQRKDCVEKIKQLSVSLADEIDKFNGGQQHSIVQSSSGLLKKVLTDIEGSRELLLGNLKNFALSILATDIIHNAIDRTVLLVVGDLADQLRFLGANTAPLSELAAVVDRVADQDSKRRFFIRKIASVFHQRLKVPARAQTFELAKIFFNCDDLVLNDITTIAPLKKPGRNK